MRLSFTNVFAGFIMGPLMGLTSKARAHGSDQNHLKPVNIHAIFQTELKTILTPRLCERFMNIGFNLTLLKSKVLF